ncbi:MAG: hypothetical protein BGO12_00335 [Verrucomicrobia bacterium 61-8]|nr:MAG: hypothetical protein BGO12_00335 [Verrucomicrobia bacterium 61-8]
MVIGLYRESGKTRREFCESEGLEPKKLERWLRAQRARQEGVGREVSIVEVEEKPESAGKETAAKYRLGFGVGAWLEVEGDFEGARVRELVEILREAAC